ncbi:MAG: phosphate signaling complex protein PhoU [Deltaproteobacteria bacterium]|nr:phosphate signaling complex protein PhoU [Deltaproteobacteria bacterium]
MSEETQSATLAHDKFHRELGELKARLLELAQAAEAAIEHSITALLHRDADLARQVITGDRAVNSLEEAIDGECVRLIALFQPVAIDLRQLMAVDHISAELERIGDSATNIAEEVLSLQFLPAKPIHYDLPRMAQQVREMVRRSLQAFLTQDPRLAREICKADDDIDSLDRSIIQDLLVEMTGDQTAIPPGMCQVNIVRNLERVGDHATNVAEQVVFMVEGESVRHRCQG